MCIDMGIVTLDEYKQKIREIKELALKELEDDKVHGIFEVILEFRDDIDLINNGIEHKVFKNFRNVKKYIMNGNCYIDDVDSMIDRAYWEVTNYRLYEGEYKEAVIYTFSLKGDLMTLRYLNWFPFDYHIGYTNSLLTAPGNVLLPFKRGDIIKINAQPFAKPIYAVYGGDIKRSFIEKNIEYKSYIHYCIYISEDRNGLWIDKLDDKFTDYIRFENSPLVLCEPADDCDDKKLIITSGILKKEPNIWNVWYEKYLSERYVPGSNLEKFIFEHESKCEYGGLYG